MDNPVQQIKTSSRAAASLPQTTQTPYFTVSGGRVAVKLYGEVTTIIEAGANNAKLVSNPTVGADVDLCAQLDIDGDAVGTMYSITGTIADAMIASTSGAYKDQADWVIVSAGSIDLYADASKTGATKWVAQWYPIDRGAVLATA